MKGSLPDLASRTIRGNVRRRQAPSERLRRPPHSANENFPARLSIQRSVPRTGVPAQSANRLWTELGWLDRLLIVSAFFFMITGTGLATIDTVSGQDHLARLNLLVLELVVVSLLLTFVDHLPTRRIGLTLALANTGLWAMAIYAGAPGGWGAIGDVFKFAPLK